MRATSETTLGVRLAELGLVPDAMMRWEMRRLMRTRLRAVEAAGEAGQRARISELRQGPIAIVPELANQQHYEVPAAFFEQVLGQHRKYSCALWERGTSDLDAAEAAMLETTCRNAGIEDGMEILELGCGWGSLSLWMARRYPGSRLLAVSNSHSQRECIEASAPPNLQVTTADVNVFRAPRRFDRVVSIEMFEHMRNYEQLLERIAGWLEPDGKLFVHLFCHRTHAYPFETEGPDNWMGRHFFSGGQMPPENLFSHFARDLVEERRWRFSGEHYRRTAEAWLRNLDARREAILPILRSTYGPSEARRWFHRWRIFFMACAELFGYREGWEWFIAHYLLGRAR
ncbi:MAG: SAM-dependent methyltransferase [Planctomycetaceae bacterium]